MWGEGTTEALLLSLVKGGGERVLSFRLPISTDCALANVQRVRGEETPFCIACASHLLLTAALMGCTADRESK